MSFSDWFKKKAPEQVSSEPNFSVFEAAKMALSSSDGSLSIKLKGLSKEQAFAVEGVLSYLRAYVICDQLKIKARHRAGSAGLLDIVQKTSMEKDGDDYRVSFMPMNIDARKMGLSENIADELGQITQSLPVAMMQQALPGLQNTLFGDDAFNKRLLRQNAGQEMVALRSEDKREAYLYRTLFERLAIAHNMQNQLKCAVASGEFDDIKGSVDITIIDVNSYNALKKKEAGRVNQVRL